MGIGLITKLKEERDSLIDWMILTTGIFSTFQITEIFGVTWFTFFVFLSSILLLAQGYNFKLTKKNKYPLYYLLVVSVSEIMIITIPLYNKNQWISSSLKKYILLLLLTIFFYKIVQLKKIDIFLKGIYISCFIEMIWCYLQFILHYKGVMINEVIWKASEVSSQGHLSLTGLNTNAGILIPAIAFLFYFSKSYYIKCLSFALFFLSGNTTMLICGIIVLFIEFVRGVKNILIRKKIRRKFLSMCLFSVCIVVAALYGFGLIDRIQSILVNLILRISEVHTNNITNASTYAHARYYTSIPEIISQIGILNVLFGFGLGCAGVPFVYVFDQYPDLIYVPESDMITYLYNIGIFGTIFFYGFLTFLCKKSIKNNKEICYFVISILISGIFYGMQLNWVIMCEWIFAYFVAYNNQDITFLSKFWRNI